VCALIAVLAVGGCVRTTHPDGTTICGVHIPSGAMAIAALPLQSPGPRPPDEPTPATSRLPAQSDPPVDYLSATYVRTSPSCDRGAVVVVDPVDQARLVVDVRASDGEIAAIGLQLTGSITVQAWIGGVFQGSARLP
jgi:hypothetical protein